MSGLGACTLSAADFSPLRVDATGSGRDAPSNSEAITPGEQAGCTPGCDSAWDGSGSEGSPWNGNVVGPSSPAQRTDETSTAALPLDEAGRSDASTLPAGEAPLIGDAGTLPVDPEPLPEPVPEPIPVVQTPLKETQLFGWAAVAGLGTETTTGGAGGETVRATTAEQLALFAALPVPLTIEIAGTLRLGRVVVASNKTLRGVGTTARLEGGVRIRGVAEAFVQNVIVQNLEIEASFSEVNGDAVQIHYAHHVWVDHCSISDAADGNLDIVHGSDFVTVSWNRFSYTSAAAGSRKSTQIGHSDEGAAEDIGHLRVTLHHNAWLDGVLGSAPRVRFGDVHVFNNYYASPSTDAAISAAVGSRLLVEGNFFENVATPYQIESGSGTGPQLRSLANVFTAATPRLDEAGAAFVPPYAYAADPALSVPELVQASAGATLSFADTQ